MINESMYIISACFIDLHYTEHIIIGGITFYAATGTPETYFRIFRRK